MHRLAVAPAVVLALVLDLLLAAAATAQDGAPRLRLLPLRDGLRGDAPQGDLARIAETPAGKEAGKVGLDLAAPTAGPVVAAGLRDGRLFFVFYKVVEEAFGPQAWMLQRIRKVERTWATADGPPEEKVTFQVEAFKTFAGTLKGADQHFGSFGLRGAHRREIVKEYEIGFGTVPGTAEGAAWPFAAKHLFHMLQEYGDDRALFDRVQFTAARTWTLTAAFDAAGAWSVRSPELGLDVPKRTPDLAATRPAADAASRAIVLTAGTGPKGLQVGTSTRADADRVLGEALEDVPAGPSSRNVSYRGGLTCNFGGDGALATVITRACFAGRTSLGIAHGSKRADVRAKHGEPAKGDAAAATWVYPGLHVAFDADGAVTRLVVAAR